MESSSIQQQVEELLEKNLEKEDDLLEIDMGDLDNIMLKSSSIDDIEINDIADVDNAPIVKKKKEVPKTKKTTAATKKKTKSKAPVKSKQKTQVLNTQTNIEQLVEQSLLQQPSDQQVEKKVEYTEVQSSNQSSNQTFTQLSNQQVEKKVEQVDAQLSIQPSGQQPDKQIDNQPSIQSSSHPSNQLSNQSSDQSVTQQPDPIAMKFKTESSVDTNSAPKIHSYDILEEWLKQYKNISLFDKIAGIIYGCALGDCLGLPLEGRSADSIKNCGVLPIVGMPQRKYKGFEKGDWTDDTDQLILLMETLTEGNLKFNGSRFAQKLVNWKKGGFKELGDVAGFGCGSLTGRVVSKDNYVNYPVSAAMEAYREMGSNVAPNGAIMRCGIIAMCKNWEKLAIQQCVITHVDSRCIYSSWLVIAICRSLMKNIIPTNDYLFKNKPYFIKKRHAEEFDKYQKIYCMDSDKMLDKLNLGDEEGMGYTLKGLGSAFYALSRIREGSVKSADDYKKYQLEIVNKGGDSDTNAAISGQVFGAYLGYSKLPKEWLSELLNKKWLDQKIIRLFKVIIESP